MTSFNFSCTYNTSSIIVNKREIEEEENIQQELDKEKQKLDNKPIPYLSKKLSGHQIELLEEFLQKKIQESSTYNNFLKQILIKSYSVKELLLLVKKKLDSSISARIKNIPIFFNEMRLSSTPSFARLSPKSPIDIYFEIGNEIDLSNKLMDITNELKEIIGEISFEKILDSSSKEQISTLSIVTLDGSQILLTISKQPFGKRHRFFKFIEEIDTESKSIIFPLFSFSNPNHEYKNYKEFEKERDSTIGCSVTDLKDLDREIPYIIGELTSGDSVDNKFLEELRQRLFLKYGSDKNFVTNFGEEIDRFFEKNVSEKLTKAKIFILLNITFISLFDPQKEEEKKFSLAIWTIIFPRIKEELGGEFWKNNLSIDKTLINNLLKNLDKSWLSLEKLGVNLLMILNLIINEESQKEDQLKFSSDLLRISLEGKSIHLMSPKNKNKSQGWHFRHLWPNPSLLLFQIDLFSKKFFQQLSLPLSEKKNEKISKLFIIKKSMDDKKEENTKTVFEILSILLDLDYQILLSTPILKKNLLIQSFKWDKLNSSDLNLEEKLNVLLKVLSTIYIIDPESEELIKQSSLYYELLTEAVILAEEKQVFSLLSNYSLPYLSIQKTICQIFKQEKFQKNLNEKKTDWCKLTSQFFNLLMTQENFSDLLTEEKEELSKIIDPIIPQFISNSDLESLEDLKFILELLSFVNFISPSKKGKRGKEKLEFSTSDKSILEIEKIEKNNTVQKKILKLIMFLLENFKEFKNLKNSESLLVQYYLDQHPVNNTDFSLIWLSLFDCLLEKKLWESSLQRLEEIVDHVSFENDIKLNLTIKFLNAAPSVYRKNSRILYIINQLFAPFLLVAKTDNQSDLTLLLDLFSLIPVESIQISELETSQSNIVKEKILSLINSQKETKAIVLESLIHFYLNHYPLEDQEEIEHWILLFNYFLKNKLFDTAFKRLDEICNASKKNECVKLKLNFLQESSPTSYHLPLLQDAAKIIFKSDKIDLNQILDLIQLWNQLVIFYQNNDEMIKHCCEWLEKVEISENYKIEKNDSTSHCLLMELSELIFSQPENSIQFHQILKLITYMSHIVKNSQNDQLKSIDFPLLFSKIINGFIEVKDLHSKQGKLNLQSEGLTILFWIISQKDYIIQSNSKNIQLAKKTVTLLYLGIKNQIEVNAKTFQELAKFFHAFIKTAKEKFSNESRGITTILSRAFLSLVSKRVHSIKTDKLKLFIELEKLLHSFELKLENSEEFFPLFQSYLKNDLLLAEAFMKLASEAYFNESSNIEISLKHSSEQLKKIEKLVYNFSASFKKDLYPRGFLQTIIKGILVASEIKDLSYLKEFYALWKNYSLLKGFLMTLENFEPVFSIAKERGDQITEWEKTILYTILLNYSKFFTPIQTLKIAYRLFKIPSLYSQAIHWIKEHQLLNLDLILEAFKIENLSKWSYLDSLLPLINQIIGNHLKEDLNSKVTGKFLFLLPRILEATLLKNQLENEILTFLHFCTPYTHLLNLEEALLLAEYLVKFKLKNRPLSELVAINLAKKIKQISQDLFIQIHPRLKKFIIFLSNPTYAEDLREQFLKLLFITKTLTKEDLVFLTPSNIKKLKLEDLEEILKIYQVEKEYEKALKILTTYDAQKFENKEIEKIIEFSLTIFENEKSSDKQWKQACNAFTHIKSLIKVQISGETTLRIEDFFDRLLKSKYSHKMILQASCIIDILYTILPDPPLSFKTSLKKFLQILHQTKLKKIDSLLLSFNSLTVRNLLGWLTRQATTENQYLQIAFKALKEAPLKDWEIYLILQKSLELSIEIGEILPESISEKTEELINQAIEREKILKKLRKNQFSTDKAVLLFLDHLVSDFGLNMGSYRMENEKSKQISQLLKLVPNQKFSDFSPILDYVLDQPKKYEYRIGLFRLIKQSDLYTNRSIDSKGESLFDPLFQCCMQHFHRLECLVLAVEAAPSILNIQYILSNLDLSSCMNYQILGEKDKLSKILFIKFISFFPFIEKLTEKEIEKAADFLNDLMKFFPSLLLQFENEWISSLVSLVNKSEPVRNLIFSCFNSSLSILISTEIENKQENELMVVKYLTKFRLAFSMSNSFKEHPNAKNDFVLVLLLKGTITYLKSLKSLNKFTKHEKLKISEHLDLLISLIEKNCKDSFLSNEKLIRYWIDLLDSYIPLHNSDPSFLLKQSSIERLVFNVTELEILDPLIKTFSLLKKTRKIFEKKKDILRYFQLHHILFQEFLSVTSLNELQLAIDLVSYNLDGMLSLGNEENKELFNQPLYLSDFFNFISVLRHLIISRQIEIEQDQGYNGNIVHSLQSNAEFNLKGSDNLINIILNLDENPINKKKELYKRLLQLKEKCEEIQLKVNLDCLEKSEFSNDYSFSKERRMLQEKSDSKNIIECIKNFFLLNVIYEINIYETLSFHNFIMFLQDGIISKDLAIVNRVLDIIEEIFKNRFKIDPIESSNIIVELISFALDNPENFNSLQFQVILGILSKALKNKHVDYCDFVTNLSYLLSCKRFTSSSKKFPYWENCKNQLLNLLYYHLQNLSLITTDLDDVIEDRIYFLPKNIKDQIPGEEEIKKENAEIIEDEIHIELKEKIYLQIEALFSMLLETVLKDILIHFLQSSKRDPIFNIDQIDKFLIYLRSYDLLPLEIEKKIKWEKEKILLFLKEREEEINKESNDNEYENINTSSDTDNDDNNPNLKN